MAPGSLHVPALLTRGGRMNALAIENRMGHSLHAPNASCLVVFGGSAHGRHLNDVVVGMPNRLVGREDEVEDEAQVAADGASGGDDDDGWYSEDDAPTAADETPASAAEAASASSWDTADAEDEALLDEYVVVGEVRTADKKAKAKRSFVRNVLTASYLDRRRDAELHRPGSVDQVHGLWGHNGDF